MLDLAFTEILAWGLIIGGAGYALMQYLAWSRPAAVIGAGLAALATKSMLLGFG